ncbi:MAG TPA: choice-of-anchor tandem repeat GloVer-containing protein [Rhizomicrobium sp.]
MFGFPDRPHGLVLAGGMAAAMAIAPGAASAHGVHVMYSFPEVGAGASPHAAVIRDTQGNLYGTTFMGGGQPNGNGTVFKLAPDGTYTVLHAFTGGPDGDGNYPDAPLIMDKSGNLFGTTQAGGIDGGCGMNGCGTVFEVASDGTESVLYIFGGGNDGAFPMGALLPDGKGGFYGTADSGGANRLGTVFHLSSRGKETVLHAFASGSDGDSPEAGLIADKAGNMYGTTNYGGGGCAGPGCGTVFKITPGGTETVLYAFTGGNDGANPEAVLIRDKAGNLYGTAEFGGVAEACGGSGCGTVFKLTAKGKFSVLYTFTGGNDGGQPGAGLSSDAQGDLYGTTLFWGAAGSGVVFKLAPGGKEHVLHTFSGGDDGAYPWSTLLKVGKGKFIGTTSGGGAYTDGTVFKIRE